jgi:hypothetical protein
MCAVQFVTELPPEHWVIPAEVSGDDISMALSGPSFRPSFALGRSSVASGSVGTPSAKMP